MRRRPFGLAGDDEVTCPVTPERQPGVVTSELLVAVGKGVHPSCHGDSDSFFFFFGVFSVRGFMSSARGGAWGAHTLWWTANVSDRRGERVRVLAVVKWSAGMSETRPGALARVWAGIWSVLVSWSSSLPHDERSTRSRPASRLSQPIPVVSGLGVGDRRRTRRAFA